MIIVRRLWEGERDAVRQLYLSLDHEDRRLRFFSALNDTAISRYVDDLDFLQGIVLGAFDLDAKLLGTLELSPEGDSTELALAVASDARGKGVGRALVARAWEETRTSSARELVLVCLTENTAMRNLAKRLGMKARFVDGDIEAHRPVPEATQQDVLQQIAIDLMSTAAWAAAKGYNVALGLNEDLQDSRRQVEAANMQLNQALPENLLRPVQAA